MVKSSLVWRLFFRGTLLSLTALTQKPTNWSFICCVHISLKSFWAIDSQGNSVASTISTDICTASSDAVTIAPQTTFIVSVEFLQPFYFRVRISSKNIRINIQFTRSVYDIEIIWSQCREPPMTCCVKYCFGQGISQRVIVSNHSELCSIQIIN